MATVLGGVVAVLLAVLFAFVGQVLVQRLLPFPLRQSHNTAIGMIYAALYIVYGVTLALSIFLVLQYFSAAQTTAESEANRVEDLYQLAEQFPEPDRGQIQTLASSYARVVIDEEWPLIGQGRASQGSARKNSPESLWNTSRASSPPPAANRTFTLTGGLLKWDDT